MAITLRCPTLEDVEQVRLWRNDIPETLRTPYPLTKEMQEDFYRSVVCDRRANSRWWSVYGPDGLTGFAGLANIEWENGLAEVSLILSPDICGKGYGGETFGLLLDEGFDNLGLSTIYGECYECNPALGFWLKMVERHGGYQTKLPRRKRWRGQLYDSVYFAFWR